MSDTLVNLLQGMDEARAARERYAERLAEHSRESVRCTGCGDSVRAVPQDGGWARIVYVFPVDDRGRCGLCAWDAA